MKIVVYITIITFNASSGIHPGLDGKIGRLGAATAIVLAGVTAEAELKSLDNVAAGVERGKGQLMLVYIAVHLYTPVYIGTSLDKDKYY